MTDPWEVAMGGGDRIEITMRNPKTGQHVVFAASNMRMSSDVYGYDIEFSGIVLPKHMSFGEPTPIYERLRRHDDRRVHHE